MTLKGRIAIIESTNANPNETLFVAAKASSFFNMTEYNFSAWYKSPVASNFLAEV